MLKHIAIYYRTTTNQTYGNMLYKPYTIEGTTSWTVAFRYDDDNKQCYEYCVENGCKVKKLKPFSLHY